MLRTPLRMTVLRVSKTSVAIYKERQGKIVDVDCFEFANAKSRNDNKGLDCHEVVPTSRNDR